jgi:zinc protease
MMKIIRGGAPAFALLVGIAFLLAGSPTRAAEVQRVVSPGGIEAWLIEDHSNPIITLDLAFRGGAGLDPAGKEGLANLVAGLLDEGAGEIDSRSFQRQLEDLSIRLSFDAGLDDFSGSLQTLTENADKAFEMLRLAVTEPRFDEEPVERIRSQILTRLARRETNPDAIAGRALRKALYPSHPYGRPVEGSRSSVATIEIADLRGFAERRLARDNLVIGVVGDITADALARRLDETFGGLPEQAASWRLPEAESQGQGEVLLVEKAVPQSVAAFGHQGIRRDDPDYYAATVANYILGGGGFASRLYEEVRERRGLAYSVYSYLRPLDFGALVMGGVGTANQRVGESIALIKAEWAHMASEGPSAEEVEDAKTFLTGSFPLRLDSSGAIAGMLVGMQLEDLGIDYLDRRNSLIEAVTLEDVRRVAATLFKPEHLTFVVVGQPDGLEARHITPDDGAT